MRTSCSRSSPAPNGLWHDPLLRASHANAPSRSDRAGASGEPDQRLAGAPLGGRLRRARRARRSDVELAVSEAVTNCIIHAFPERADGKITLRAEIRGSRLAITVSDDGTGMRPNLASRGLGIGIPLSTVLLYTDGLIERREHDIDVAIERLKQAFASGPEEPAEIVESLPAQFGAEREQDDIALLAARIGVS
ncbi:MAG: ATP-binding protein [Solirubrobacterales bacterium]